MSMTADTLRTFPLLEDLAIINFKDLCRSQVVVSTFSVRPRIRGLSTGISSSAHLMSLARSSRGWLWLPSYRSSIKVVFAKKFGIDVFVITVSFVEVTSVSAVLIAFSATGSGPPVSTISGSSTQMTGPFNQESVNEDLRYIVSSVNANVAEDFAVTLEFGTTKAEEVAASVLHPTWQRIAPSASCACLPSVVWKCT